MAVCLNGSAIARYNFAGSSASGFFMLFWFAKNAVIQYNP
jgi:hypothetical protein